MFGLIQDKDPYFRYSDMARDMRDRERMLCKKGWDMWHKEREAMGRSIPQKPPTTQSDNQT